MISEETREECLQWIEKNGLIDYGGAKKKIFLEAFGIGETTFRKWMKDPEWARRVEEAKETWKHEVKDKAFTGLMKLVQGYDVEEKHTEYVPNAQGKPIINKQKVFVKHIPPNPSAVIFALTNLDPENWKNRQDVDNKLQLDGVTININSKGGLPARTIEDVSAIESEAQPEALQSKRFNALNEGMKAMLIEAQQQTEDAEAKVIEDANI